MAVSKSFTALGRGETIVVQPGESFAYSISGTFSATWQLLQYDKGTQAASAVLATGTGASSGTIVNRTNRPVRYGFACSAFTSGTMVTSVSESSTDLSRKLVLPAGVLSKVGATSGWVVGAASNIALATCPASQTASTLVIPVTGLQVGDVISGFSLLGQIESAGNTATLDASLRKMTSAAADVSDASVAAMTQISVTADTIISATNSLKEIAAPGEVVGIDETFYLLVTATTAASTDIALQGAVIYLD